jgi:hypothetical protein
MATIRKIVRKKGVTYQVCLRDKAGNQLKTKTFQKLADAKLWSKKMESDRKATAFLSKRPRST